MAAEDLHRQAGPCHCWTLRGLRRRASGRPTSCRRAHVTASVRPWHRPPSCPRFPSLSLSRSLALSLSLSLSTRSCAVCAPGARFPPPPPRRASSFHATTRHRWRPPDRLDSPEAAAGRWWIALHRGPTRRQPQQQGLGLVRYGALASTSWPGGPRQGRPLFFHPIFFSRLQRRFFFLRPCGRMVCKRQQTTYTPTIYIVRP